MRRVVESLSNLKEKKGVSVFHTGRGAISAELAYSHTASLASPGSVFSGACRQQNISFAATAADAVVMADWLGRKRLTGGNRVAVLSSGSQSMYLADLCESMGFSLPELTTSQKEEISKALTRTVPLRNPMDLVAGNLRAIGSVVRTLGQGNHSDMVIYGIPSIEQLLLISPDDRERLWEDLCELTTANTVKPIVGVEWFGAASDEVRARLTSAGQLVVAEPEEAVRILWALR
jgi:acyl-CoA synthetase (NDP forming)